MMATEALAPQAVHALRRHGARIDLDRVFAALVGREAEAAPQVRHQFAHLRVGQVSGGAAAEVQLLDLVHAGEQQPLHLDFALQVGQVGGGLVAPPGDDLVAGTVVADALAERDVQVQRQRTLAARAHAGHRMQVVAIAEVGAEAVGGGIGGVAGTGLAEPGQQVAIELDGRMEHDGGLRRDLGGGRRGGRRFRFDEHDDGTPAAGHFSGKQRGTL